MSEEAQKRLLQISWQQEMLLKLKSGRRAPQKNIQSSSILPSHIGRAKALCRDRSQPDSLLS
jgi:hypothetical protein